LLVAKLREQRKWIGLCEAEVQHAQDRMLSERQPPSQAVYVRSSVCDAHLGYRYFGKPHEQAAYNLGQPPHERMHRCCEPFVLDTRFGTRTLTERPHYGPHGLPHHQVPYSDYGLPQPPHQQEWLDATKRRGRAVLQRIDEDLRNLEHPYFQAGPAETAAPIGRLFEPRHSQDGIAQQQPFIGRQPTVVTAEVVGSFPEQHCFWQQPTYSDYGLPDQQVAICDYDGLHEPPHEHTVFVEQHPAHSAASHSFGPHLRPAATGMDGEQAERSAKRRRCSDGGGDGDLGNDADCLQYDACGSEFGSEYFDGSACSDGDSSPAGSSEDDSGSGASGMFRAGHGGRHEPEASASAADRGKRVLVSCFAPP
jgi:hypothetical protein